MAKSYCKFCWAKLGDGSCFCEKELRPANCRKAREREKEQQKQQEELSSTDTYTKEIECLREYLSYIPRRMAYLRIFYGNACIDSNEYKYLAALIESIKNFGKNHVVYFKYLIKRYSFKKLEKLYGRSERSCRRIIKPQQSELLALIEEKERALYKQYPFDKNAELDMEGTD